MMSIQNFFNDKHIFITGGSGFIGKVLIEKLLRSCDGIEKIYVLLRNKKNQTSQERIKRIFDSNLFSKLKLVKPEAIKKVIPIYGDVIEPKLGLSDEDTQCLIDNVDIIYHAAASVRFDDHLKDSILLNTRGTREIVNLALQAKKLVTFIHVSTAYCQSDKKYVEEKLYPAHTDWRDAIKLAEEVDQHTLNIFSTKFIEPLPNTYTFSKSLAEHVVNDLCKGKLLAAIVRPSVVTSTIDEPHIGWTDNFNGPMGLLLGCAKGLVKVCYGDIDVQLDVVPADAIIKMLILITHQKTLSKDKNEVSVYNAASCNPTALKFRDVHSLGSKIIWTTPYHTLLWYPSTTLTNCWYWYQFIFLFYQIFPALFFDGIIKLSGHKPIIFKIQKKLYVANMVLNYFMTTTWTFVNDKCVALGKCISDSDAEEFSFIHHFRINSQRYDYIAKTKMAACRNLFNEEYNEKKGYRNTYILWVVDRLLHIIMFGLLGWFLISKIQIISIVTKQWDAYLQYLHEL